MSSSTLTPRDFIEKWGLGGPAHALNEEQGAQSHFLDLCEVLGVPKPGTADDYRFEEKGKVVGGRTGYADVSKRGHFAWENKAPGKNLDVALRQLLTYSLALDNPPLLVVCDRLNVRIHTQFTGHPSETHNIRIDQFDQPEKLALLRRLWTDPESFRPKRTTRDITEAAARSFANLAEQLRRRNNDPEQVAHFLTQCLFCFFAEDVGLLPGRMFERLVNNKHLTTGVLTEGLAELFEKMRDGGLYGPDHIPWFNGGLFNSIAVPKLEILDVTELRNAAGLNWSAIDVSIFGTLFERGLDPKKRGQLGAHYTDPATIMRIVEPVVVRPLLAAWEATAKDVAASMAKSKKRNDKHHRAAQAQFVGWLQRLESWRVLDPACGSGNFLFLALKALKDIEHKSHLDAAALGLDRHQDLVTGPDNVLGIEINEYAAELARVTIWIGELQWRIDHGYPFKTNPILESLEHIECRDAVLDRVDGPDGQRYVEAEWPRSTVVIGNPPFLGVSRKRRELGDEYTEALDAVFARRVPGGADLVCYWFAKALKEVDQHGLGGAGLVATNSIRGGANRKVLEAIVARSQIFEAWSDEPWINEGAAVRVSLVCFGNGDRARLNGADVPQIYADLTAPTTAGDSLNLSMARPLDTNMNASFQGASKKAKFEIDAEFARNWLRLPNPNGRPNSDVLKPWANGFELSRGPQHQWIIDFGNDLDESAAALYEAPFAYAAATVRPGRLTKSETALSKYWWRFGRPRVELRLALQKLSRYIATVAHSKYRLFVWLPVTTSPDQALITMARADDVTMGLLQSRFHELWSLRMGTSIGVGNDPRYTPTTCFETFPFPQGLTPKDTADQLVETLPDGSSIPRSAAVRPIRTAAIEIARAAKRLTDLRDAWLKPPEWTERVPEVVPLGMTQSPYPDRIIPKHGYEKQMAARTLTNLYNQRPAWLDGAHEGLDQAVATAYGWTDYSATMSDETVLSRLLALNLGRSQAGAAAAAPLAMAA